MIDRQSESSEYLAEYGYPFVEKHPEKIRKDYLGTISDSIERDYGVKISDVKLKLMDDLVFRYPTAEEIGLLNSTYGIQSYLSILWSIFAT